VRILLAGMSNMLSAIVTAAIAHAADIVVAGRVADGEDLGTKIGLLSADAVIAQTDRPDAAESFLPLLHSFPALKVMAINCDCSRGFLHQLRPQSIRLPEISADLLQSVLRTQISVTWNTDWSAVLQLMRTDNRGLL
jgi:hypothetical protein